MRRASNTHMKDPEKLAALNHLLELMSLGENPTARETGLPLATILGLRDEKLIAVWDLGGKSNSDDMDRYIVTEITMTGKSWLIRANAKAKHASLHPPLWKRFLTAVFGKLWDLFWKVATGFFAGWLLGHYSK